MCAAQLHMRHTYIDQRDHLWRAIDLFEVEVRMEGTVGKVEISFFEVE